MKILSTLPLSLNFSACQLFVMLWIFSGCAPQYQVMRAQENLWHDMMHESALHTSQLSYYTKWFLYNYQLRDDFKKNPILTLIELDRTLCENLLRDNLFSMAELCFYQANQEKKDYELQLKLYMTASRYAYAFLFERIADSCPDPYDPRFRMACDFYNRSLAKCIGIILTHKTIFDAVERKLSFLNGDVYIQWTDEDRLFQPSDFELWLDPYDYKTKGIEFVHRKYGIGAPLIAIKTISYEELSIRVGDSIKDDIQLTYPKSFILRYRDSICEHATEKTETAIGELYDPTRDDYVEIGEKKIPIESDFTMPIAYRLSHETTYDSVMAMLNTRDYEKKQGLFFLQPFDPNKIPIVFIHGLMSSPYTWVEMFNTLFVDPSLHKKYQFWFYCYPTGDPIIVNADRLRQTLLRTKSILDPVGDNVYFNQMVLVGHSMGGILTKMMVQSSPKDLWNAYTKSDLSIDQLAIPGEYKDYYHRLFEFEPLPFVTRVIFMSTPHRGSRMADSFVGQLGASMISLPSYGVKMIKTTLAAVENENRNNTGINITSINNLSPKDPGLLKMVDMPISTHVKAHSIIGNDREAHVPGGGDGIVSYRSAHLDNVESELIIHCNHETHKNPSGIREVHRILLKHLEEN